MRFENTISQVIDAVLSDPDCFREIAGRLPPMYKDQLVGDDKLLRILFRQPEGNEIVRDAYQRELNRFNGNVVAFARHFCISRDTVYEHMKKYGVDY